MWGLMLKCVGLHCIHVCLCGFWLGGMWDCDSSVRYWEKDDIEINVM